MRLYHRGHSGGASRPGARQASPLGCPLWFDAVTARAAMSEIRAVGADDLGVEAGARLGGALLGGEVDVDDAEALGVAVAPLEVVEEGPGEVAAEVDAGLDRAAGGAQVVAVVGDAQRVVDRAAVGRGRVVEGGAVLGDVERDAAVAARDPGQHVG